MRPSEIIAMTRRTFQITFGFWFAVASLNGFMGGLAVCEIGHLMGWLR